MNQRPAKATGTVWILLALLENDAALPSSRAHAGKVLGDLGAATALPTLRRLAKDSSAPEVQAAAKEAMNRITDEHKTQNAGKDPPSF